MKIILKYSRVAILALFFQTAAISHGVAQTVQYPNYVIIGAFSISENAVKFTALVKRSNLQADYAININRKLYYVYVLRTSDQRVALQEARKLRRLTKFKDAWVYNGPLGKDVEQTTVKSVDINPDTGDKMDSITKGAGAITDRNDTVTQTSSNDSTASETKDEIVNNAERKFKLELFRASDFKVIDGDVEVIDLGRARKLGTYKGNTAVKINKPSGTHGEVAFVSKVFGYRKEQRKIDFDNPVSEDIVIDDSTNIVVPFPLVRLQKGDIAVMYSVFFFKDAAVMQPSSQYEVNSLLEMLKENPAYKIRIHGHTNGNSHGKIITASGTNFFSLTDSKEGFGSARKLSEERAKVIREYLMSKGIPGERMKIKAWGGKRPIYDKIGPRAQENVRVEIEILADI